MPQTITVKVKLLPTKEQIVLLEQSSHEYIKVIHDLVSEMVEEKKSTKKSTKDIEANIPSAVKNQVIQDAKSVFSTKVKKSTYKIVPILKRPVCVWNNQNDSFEFRHISIPFMVNGKSTRLKVRALLIDKYNRNFELLKHKLGTLRITNKSAKWIAQISVTIPTNEKRGTKILGVDLGLNVPTVVITDDDKEQKWMQDHKVSREIVDFATDNNISVIQLKHLTNMRQTARTSRKNEKNLNTWSFHCLAPFIAYKATLVGIKVEYVNPSDTSQTHPEYSENNKAQHKKYKC